jgi:Cadherin-like domain
VWSLVSNAANGVVVMNADGTFSYTPNANYNGNDSFTYKITDANGDTSTAIAKICVAPGNEAPCVASNKSDPSKAYFQYASTQLGHPAIFVVNSTAGDLDGDKLIQAEIKLTSTGSDALYFNAAYAASHGLTIIGNGTKDLIIQGTATADFYSNIIDINLNTAVDRVYVAVAEGANHLPVSNSLDFATTVTDSHGAVSNVSHAVVTFI